MSGAAYWINGQQVDDERFYATACNPRRSVVVEACAGAGKTWMLVSRVVRALLEGCAPQEILAITFTRKAAAEMRERLSDWLREFAASEPEQRVAALMLRGMSRAQAEQAQAALGALRMQVLQSARSVGVHTFHGWFWQLIRSAPMDLLLELGLSADMQLLEDVEEILPDAWRRCMQAVAQTPELLADYTALVGDLGRHSTRKWLEAALSRRVEIELADAAGVLDTAVPSGAQWLPQWAHLPSPHDALREPAVEQALRAMVREWSAHKNKTPKDAARELDAALADAARGDADMAAVHQRVKKALLTASGGVKAKLPDHPSLNEVAEVLQRIQQMQDQQQAHDSHMRMVRLTRALLAAYEQVKRARALADMADLERAALHLLRDATLSAWMQERLDARVRHVLIDEFQDTSPLQWQALQAWLAGYAGAGGGASGHKPPSVFIVGDPKQSIYRFRRAEPRVFLAAQAFVTSGLDGALLACDHTRRNAQAVLDVLNAGFDAAQASGAYQGYRPHTTAADVQGAVRVLPQVKREAKSEQAEAPRWRDSLTEPRVLPDEAQRLKEGRQVALAVAELLAQGYKPSDIYVLARKRDSLRWAAEALREQGIAHAAPEDKALLDSSVARDLIAVLEAIVSPGLDLPLAHALRSPLFGVSDDDLMALKYRTLRTDAARGAGAWWQALAAWGEDHDAAGMAANGTQKNSTQTNSTQENGTQKNGTPDTPSPALQRARALLTQWRQAQHKLPPHDLLALIVEEGDLRARLAAALPPAHRAAGLAHVDAVLAQALALDAGRYATPYNFVRALKRRPIQLAMPQQPDAVQLLTVHGAKGLEARAVFIIDTDPNRSNADSYTMLIDWPVESAHPECCAFVRSESNPPPSLREAMAAEQQARLREELNALYVAITRARELLVFSRNEPYSRSETSWWRRMEAALAEPASSAWEPQAAPVPLAVSRQTQADADFDLHVLPPMAPRAPDAVSTPPEAINAERAAVGHALHLALQWLTERPPAARAPRDRNAAVALAARRFGLGAEGALLAAQAVNQILDSAELGALLDPAQATWCGNEVELMFAGDLLRVDRLVHLPAGAPTAITPDASGAEAGTWWVLDYKLDAHPQSQPAYLAQLARYAQAVRAVQPEARVRAAFVTAAGRLIEPGAAPAWAGRP